MTKLAAAATGINPDAISQTFTALSTTRMKMLPHNRALSGLPVAFRASQLMMPRPINVIPASREMINASVAVPRPNDDSA